MSGRFPILGLAFVSILSVLAIRYPLNPKDARRAQLDQERAELISIQRHIEADGRDLAAQREALKYVQAQIIETEKETQPVVSPK